MQKASNHVLLPSATLLLGALPLLVLLFSPMADPLPRLLQALQQWLWESPVEKVYVMTDKPLYAVGETVWYRAWLVNGLTHTANSPSGVLYVELHDPQGRLVSQQRLRVDSSAAHGDIALADTLLAGAYTLRAYTTWMRNAGEAYFFRRILHVASSRGAPSSPDASSGGNVPVADNPITAHDVLRVALLPEGGDLVAGLQSRVAIQVLDISGEAWSVTGYIQDDTGSVVVPFVTDAQGIATVYLTPHLGRTYTAMVENGLARSEPVDPRPFGVTLEVDGSKPDQVTLSLRSSLEGSLVLLAHVRGDVVFAARTKPGRDDFQAQWPRSRFPAGLIHFTVFDHEGEALAERLLYNPVQDSAEVRLITDQPRYGQREHVTMTVDVPTLQGTEFQGDFAVTVVNNSLVADSLWGNLDIRSWLLAGADLASGFEWQDDIADIDRLMLTKGWRRFRWRDLEHPLTAPTYDVETGFRISGRIVDNVTKRAARDQELSVFTMGHRSDLLQLRTDDQGRFEVEMFMTDTTDIVVQTWNRRNRRHYEIRLDPFWGPAPAPPWQPRSGPTRSFFEYLIATRQRLFHEREFGLDPNYRLLGEIVVEAERDVDTWQQWAKPTVRADYTFKAEDAIHPSTMAPDLLRGQPRVRVNAFGVIYFGMTPARVYVDGVESTEDFYRNMPAEWIDHVDLIWDRTMLLGTSFLGQDQRPIVAFYTKRDRKVLPRREGIINVRHPGYYAAREFHSPNYAVSDSLHHMPDHRSTLAWVPFVRTDTNGQAKILFWTGDLTGSFRVRLEGLLPDGTPVVVEEFFRVE